MVGVPDEVLGQAIKAFVTLAPGAAADRARRDPASASRTWRASWCRSHVEFVESLPKTDTGKIKKTGLA